MILFTHSILQYFEFLWKICKMIRRKYIKTKSWIQCQSLFFNKAAGLRPGNLLTKRPWHMCFPVKFAKFLRTPFFIVQLQVVASILKLWTSQNAYKLIFTTWWPAVLNQTALTKALQFLAFLNMGTHQISNNATLKFNDKSLENKFSWLMALVCNLEPFLPNHPLLKRDAIWRGPLNFIMLSLLQIFFSQLLKIDSKLLKLESQTVQWESRPVINLI